MTRIITTPAEIGGIARNYLTQLRANENRLVPILLPGLDGYFGPGLPSEMIEIVGWSSNGKSTFMRNWASRLARYYLEMGVSDPEGGPGGVIGWVDTETTMEHLALSFMAREAGISVPAIVYGKDRTQIQALNNAARRIAGSPIYALSSRPSEGTGTFDEVTLTNALKWLLALKNGNVDEWKHVVLAAFFDYLQSFPVDPKRSKYSNDGGRRLQVLGDVNEVRRMGGVVGMASILGVQANQEMRPRGPQLREKVNEKTGEATPPEIVLPDMYSGAETAETATRPDRILTIGTPARMGYRIGKPIRYEDQVFVVTAGLVFVYVAKQRLDGLPAGGMFVYEYTPEERDVFKKYKLLYADDQGYKAPWKVETPF